MRHGAFFTRRLLHSKRIMSRAFRGLLLRQLRLLLSCMLLVLAVLLGLCVVDHFQSVRVFILGTWLAREYEVFLTENHGAYQVHIHCDDERLAAAVSVLKRLPLDVRQRVDGAYFWGPGLTDRSLGCVELFPNLARVVVGRDTSVSDDGVRRLGILKRLRELHLNAKGLSCQTVKQLRALRTLVYVDLNGTRVDDSCLPLLAALPELETVTLLETSVTAEGVRDLRRRRPDVKVFW